MVRRKITFGDWLRGAAASVRSGNGMNPITTQRFVNAAHDQRVASETSVRALFVQVALQAFNNYQAAREGDSRWRMVGDQEVKGGRDIQYVDGDYSINVLNGYSRDKDQYTTDIIITDLTVRGNLHMHIVFDENGRIITEHWKHNGKIIPPPH